MEKNGAVFKKKLYIKIFLPLLMKMKLITTRHFLLSDISLPYLLRWCDALLFVELCALFGFAVQAEALLKSLLFQH